jgi:arginine decarboxylase
VGLFACATTSNIDRHHAGVIVAETWRVEDSLDLYGISRWGRDYFTANRKGHLAIRPTTTATGYADIKDMVDDLVARGVSAPILLRFPQLISDRVDTLYSSFSRARKAYGYSGRLRAVFPMKVNQEKEVIEEVMRVGNKHDYGIEVGSKAELLAAIALKENPRSLLICNGYKDYEFIELACYASLFRKNVMLVVDKLDEVDLIIRASRATKAKPMIGIRVKLHARGGGKWVESGGERAKFGLTVPGIMHAVEAFSKAKMKSQIKMLHFHVGSQITDIKKVHLSLREAARIYASLVKMKVPLKLIDCGGGLGLDYDGSQSTAPMSVNYDVGEYVNTIVYTLKSICDDAGVPYPDVVTESGRGVAGHHAVLVAEILPKGQLDIDPRDVEVRDSDPLPLHELHESMNEITAKNYIEIYHDALTQREDMMNLFNLGQIDIDSRARAEILFREICRRVIKFLKKSDDLEDLEEEWEGVRKLLAHKYVVNYSLFQSTPDVWGVKQLFPVTPIHRLDEEPTETGTLCDLTCDSDGEVKRFIDMRSIKDVLELHKGDGDSPYYLAFTMLGAYQDVLGNFHNMFGPVNEAFVELGKNGSWKITKIIHGGTARDMLVHMNYDPEALKQRVELLTQNGAAAGASAEQVRSFVASYAQTLAGYTYLKGPSDASREDRRE